MKIGFVSDTHDHLTKIRNVVALFNSHKVEYILHAGDFVSPFALSPFELLSCEWVGVFGNNDGDKPYLTEKSRGRIKEPPFFLELNSKKIALMHKFQKVDADIIVCGHTHKPEIKKEDNMVIINPGEACGWLFHESSVVILDLDTLEPEKINF